MFNLTQSSNGKNHILVVLKPGKDSNVAVNWPSGIIIASTNESLRETGALKRVQDDTIESNLLIPEQAGFREGKSSDSQYI